MALGTAIIVPGITGSQLSVQLPFGLLGPVVWLSPGALAAGFWRTLKLAADGQGPEDANLSLAPGGALPFYYDIWRNYLWYRGWRVTDCVMDWRKTVREDGWRLATQIRSGNYLQPIVLLCHSRGGLVARWALDYLYQTGDQSKVSRVVGCGVPHTGSLAATQLVAGIDASTLALESIVAQLPPLVAPLAGLDEVAATARTWPGAYELMPRPGALWVQGILSTDLYVLGNWTDSGVPVSALHLHSAETGWLALPPVPLGFDWIDVCCDQLSTLDGIDGPDGFGDPNAYQVGAAGDGIVPYVSAHQSDRRVIFSPTSHRAFPWDGRLAKVIGDVLQNGLAANVRLSGEIYN